MNEELPAPGSDPFVNLHVHSEYSLLDGASRVQEIVKAAKELGQSAVAITDHGVLYGAVALYEAAKEEGIKPIVGCEVYMAQRSRFDKETKEDRDPWHLVALAQNPVGYHNLSKMISRASLEGFYQKPRVDRELLAEHSEGLIVLSGCLGGEVAQAIMAGDIERAEKTAGWYKELFGDRYYLEVHNHGIPEEEVVKQELKRLSKKLQIPLVATGDSHYTYKSQAEAHDVMLCIQTNAKVAEEKRFRFSGLEGDYYFKSSKEMLERFPDMPEAIYNTRDIADRCSFELELGKNQLPRFGKIPAGMTDAQFLEQQCQAGIRERYGENPGEVVAARLKEELEVINGAGFSSYFLIVSDFVNAARENGGQVGPGRGSAAGSLVSYSLGITNVEPLKYGLVFERFLNRERVEMPDIDVDFDDRKRGETIKYIEKTYGRENVAQVITFGTLGAKAAIRDVARVLEVPIPEINRLAKLIPGDPGITIEHALANSSELSLAYQSEAWVKKVIDIAMDLEGLCRNASTNASAVVITPRPVMDLVPVQRPTGASEQMLIQMDKNTVAKLGLLKMDVLGLANLTVINDAVELIEKVYGIHVDISKIPLDDAAAFELLCRGDVHGIFQCEGAGAKRIILEMQPRELADMSAAVALNRPGPLESGAVATYLKRRQGREEVDYPLPELETVLKDTFGVTIYQEQVMQIAQVVAGYSLGEADVLRSAMGKKNEVKMEKERKKFIKGALANGYSEEVADGLFAKLAVFAHYGFNKAHSVAYGLVGYQCAYLKAHYPREYLAALLTMKKEQDTPDKPKMAECIMDAKEHGLRVLSPNVNKSSVNFDVAKENFEGIHYGLHWVKGVGKASFDIVAAREKDGPFTSLLDLVVRVPKGNRRVWEALILAGGMEDFGERAQLLASLDLAIEKAKEIVKERTTSRKALTRSAVMMTSGFRELTTKEKIALIREKVRWAKEVVAARKGENRVMMPQSTKRELSAYPVSVEFQLVSSDKSGKEGVKPATKKERLDFEKELLGGYVSGHPLDDQAEVLSTRSTHKVIELDPVRVREVQLAGIFRSVNKFVPKKSKNGMPMARVEFEDMTGNCKGLIFATNYAKYKDLIKEGAVVVLRARVAEDQQASSGKEEEGEESSSPSFILHINEVMSPDEKRSQVYKVKEKTPDGPVLQVEMREGSNPQLLSALKSIIEKHRGEVPVRLRIASDNRSDSISLPTDKFGVVTSSELEVEIEQLLGQGSYRILEGKTALPKNSLVATAKTESEHVPERPFAVN